MGKIQEGVVTESGQCRTPLENSFSASEISNEFGGLNAFMNSLLSRENPKGCDRCR